MSEEDNEKPQSENFPLEIPLQAISEDALKGIIDGFIFREGTDYGKAEASHEIKFAQIHKQLINGSVKLIYDPQSESVNLVPLKEWNAFQAIRKGKNHET